MQRPSIDDRFVPTVGRDVPPQWVMTSHAAFARVLFDSDRPFPCFFAPEAERRGDLAYSWLDRDEIAEPVRLHRAIGAFIADPAYRSDRAGLVVLCRLPADTSSEAAFWTLMRHLLAHDPTPWPSGACLEPDDAAWGFHYAGEELFVNAHSGAHRRRCSRSAVVDLMLVIQRSSNFADVIGRHGPSKVQLEIRKKLADYDAAPLHPSLKIPAADPQCRAWRQFWVPDDDDGPDTRTCPLHDRTQSADGGRT